MSKAEERARQAYPYEGGGKGLICEASIPIFIRGYEQAEKDLGWISVKDKLPNPSEWVVVCVNVHNIPQCLALATYNGTLGKWFTDDFEDGEQEEYYPDYWMAIPKLPNEDVEH